MRTVNLFINETAVPITCLLDSYNVKNEIQILFLQSKNAHRHCKLTKHVCKVFW